MSSTSDKPRSLAGGISILGISGMICKVVGVLFRIPLVNSIGALGVAVYQQVFPSYNLMLTISSAGLPVAVSRMVAHHLNREEPGRARQVFRISLVLLSVLGLLSMLLMVLLAPQLARGTGTQESRLGFMMIAPSLLFVCVMSAFRGYMQGQRRMVPTAISQLIEQVGKVAIAIPLAVLGFRRGGYAMGAAGALLGTSIAEAAALLYMLIDYRMQRSVLARAGAEALLPRRQVARSLTFTAVPITIGASIVPLAGAADSFMLVNIMSGYMARNAALTAYGVYTGMVITMINVPTALAMAMSSNLVPAIAGHRARGDYEGIRRESATGLRLASAVGFPASVGMSMLAFPILNLLFGRGGDSPQDILLGARLLEVSSLTILLFTQVQATSGILQGLHKQRIPMYTLAAGMALKVALNYTLVRYPAIGIGGAPFASLLCYAVSLVPNLWYVAKHARMKLDLREILTAPALATALMALAVWGLQAVLGARLNTSWLWLGVTMLAAAAVYFAAAFRLGALKAQDLPGRLRRKLGSHA